MITHRGVNRSSYIAGTSTHNTRIERLWRDMRQHTIQAYIGLFYSLESEGLDLCNLLHIFTLQYLFIPVINEALSLFVQIWNNHFLSTEYNRTPKQLLSYLELNYGVDEDGGYTVDDTSISQVDCFPMECPLNEFQLTEFKEVVSPLTLAVGFSNFKMIYRDGLRVIKDIFFRSS